MIIKAPNRSVVLPSLADVTAAAHFSAVDYLGDVNWDKHPGAKDWYARVKSRPAMRTILAAAVTSARDGSTTLLLERGILRRLAGDTAGARADWTRIVETDPGSPAAKAARNNLANLESAAE